VIEIFFCGQRPHLISNASRKASIGYLAPQAARAKARNAARRAKGEAEAVSEANGGAFFASFLELILGWFWGFTRGGTTTPPLLVIGHRSKKAVFIQNA
jgi:hypothetical protein